VRLPLLRGSPCRSSPSVSWRMPPWVVSPSGCVVHTTYNCCAVSVIALSSWIPGLPLVRQSSFPLSASAHDGLALRKHSSIYMRHHPDHSFSVSYIAVKLLAIFRSKYGCGLTNDLGHPSLLLRPCQWPCQLFSVRHLRGWRASLLAPVNGVF
jgi:hypothetical protein